MKPTWLRKSIFLGLTMAALTGCIEAENGNTDADEMNGALFQQTNITRFEMNGTKQVALTYDDGPTPQVTAALLELLREYNIKATFFVLGQSMGQETIMKRMRADGHIIANHSYSHEDLSKKVYENNKDSLLHQVRNSHSKIAPFMNPAHRMYFRAPYGAWRKTHAQKLNQYSDIKDYIGPVFWDVGGEIRPRGTRPQSSQEIQAAADWDCWASSKTKKSIPVEVCAAGYFKEIQSKKGGVVLMHDKNMKTVELTAILIPKLIKEGYRFVTLDDLRVLDQYE